MFWIMMLGCQSAGEEDSAGPLPFSAPDQPGPHLVGTYASELDAEHGVTLPVQVWYPAAEEASLHVYDELWEGGALDEPRADCGALRPVMLFSHGNGGIRWQTYTLMEFWASHGWIVVAPDHIDNTFLDLKVELTGEVMVRRPKDIAAAYDWLLGEASDGGQLAGCVDSERGYHLSGHSFGGYTTLATGGASMHREATQAHCSERGGWLCEEGLSWLEENPDLSVLDQGDPRVLSLSPMAPAGYEITLGGLPEVEVPVLLMGATLDSLTTMEEQVLPVFEDLTVVPRQLAEFHESGHYAFSNACTFAPIFDECLIEDFRSEEDMQATLKTLTMAWLQDLEGHEEAAAWLPPDDPLLSWTSLP